MIHLNLEFEEATAQSSKLKALPIQELRKVPINEIRELRKIKNRLRVLSGAMSSGSLSKDPDLTSWMQLKNILP
jgi:hypothetical protein